MTRPEGYKQINLHEIDWAYYDNRSGDKLQGKVVDKVGFYNLDDDEEKQMFVIVFTDKTFIAIGVKDTDDEDRPTCKLNNKWIYNGDLYKESVSLYSTHVDIDGNVVYDTWVDMLIKLGLWKFSDDEIREMREKHFQSKRDREYAQYLELKKKFEGT